MISYGRRLTFAFRTFFSILVHGRIPDDVAAELVKREPATPAPAVPPAPSSDRAVQLLSILQRDGRLIDFLMEDLTAYADAQIGAAARDVHGGCRQALDRYFTLVPVVDDEEGRPITVEPGADPARIKVMGNAVGKGPFRGVLRHRGWETTRTELPPLPASSRQVLAPAEVELT